MASERLMDAMNRVRSLGANKSKTNIPYHTAEIGLEPLDSIEADLSQPVDTSRLDDMKLKVPKLGPYDPGDQKPKVITAESFSIPIPGLPKPEPFSLERPKEEPASFDWNDINDRRMLLDAQLKAESGYNPDVQSPVGAQGIAQFMPSTWEEYQNRGWVPKDKSPYDVGAALQGQRKYMERMFGRDLISQAPDSLTQIKMALAGYNAGYGNVSKAYRKATESGNPDEWLQYLPSQETRDYIEKILNTAESHKKTNYDSKFNWGYKKQGGILRTTTKS